MATEQMECPQCGEEAVNTPPTDPVPWAAHGTDQPQWSHTDGSSLCPVLGGSGGYAPAQPQPKTAAHQPAQWAGRGFTRPGPGAEVPRDLYRAALEDALAYTTDHDG